MEKEKRTDFVAVHKGSCYDSDFESDGEFDRNKLEKRKHDDNNDDELSSSLFSSKKKHKKDKKCRGKREEVEKEFCKEESRTRRFHIVSMDAYSRHKKFINDYMLYYRGNPSCAYKRDTSKDKTDLDVIRENHRFLWDDDGEDEESDSWEKRLAKKYYDKLFKEYCITDLSRYKENKVAFRWQMEKEVVSGKGQFVCANKLCQVKEGLRSWEVNFGYVENGQRKNALVKVRLCPDCSYKLNYHHRRKEVTVKKKSNNLTNKSTRKDGSINKGHVDPTKEGSSSSADEEDREKKQSQPDDKQHDGSVWSKPSNVLKEKSRQEEFEEYFEDMFL